MVVADARGMCLIVEKNRNSADIPANPLMINHFLLFPKKGMPKRLIQIKQITNEINDRKKTISWVGMPSRYLTQKFTTA
jgi:hypothetical protein